jgi:hypothetical protein
MNSLHRILLTALTILATSTFLYLLWKTFSLIGRPLGRSLTNLLTKLSDDGGKSDDDDEKNDNTNSAITNNKPVKEEQQQQISERTSSMLSALLGFFLFITLFPLALENSDEIPSEWIVIGMGRGSESGRLVSALLWVGWTAVRCWGETLVVVGVLSGVVKGLGLDVAAPAAAGSVGGGEEKDVKSS